MANASEKYGLSWRFAPVGIVVSFGSFLTLLMMLGLVFAGNPALTPFNLPISHGIWLGLLLIALLLCGGLKLGGGMNTVRGVGRPRDWVLGALAVLALYLADFGYCVWRGIPKESHMALLYVGKTPSQVMLFLATALLVTPVAEELAFRHFLLGIVPHRSARLWALVGTVGTAAVFAFSHGGQYEHGSTLVLLFLLGCVFALARIVTNGLALPIAMHFLAILTALLLNELR